MAFQPTDHGAAVRQRLSTRRLPAGYAPGTGRGNEHTVAAGTIAGTVAWLWPVERAGRWVRLRPGKPTVAAQGQPELAATAGGTAMHPNLTYLGNTPFQSPVLRRTPFSKR